MVYEILCKIHKLHPDFHQNRSSFVEDITRNILGSFSGHSVYRNATDIWLPSVRIITY